MHDGSTRRRAFFFYSYRGSHHVREPDTQRMMSPRYELDMNGEHIYHPGSIPITYFLQHTPSSLHSRISPVYTDGSNLPVTGIMENDFARHMSYANLHAYLRSRPIVMLITMHSRFASFTLRCTSFFPPNLLGDRYASGCQISGR